MAELDAQPPPSLAAGRSRKLTRAVVVLAILPLVLPFLFIFPAVALTNHVIISEWAQCPAYCPPSTDGERLEWLLTLGPSILVAVASILFGAIGIARRTTSPKDAGKYGVSLGFGICWAVLGLCIYGFIFVVTGIVP